MNTRSRLSNMKRILGFAILSLGIISNIHFVNAGEKYEEKSDRFRDTKSASYKSKLPSECKLTKSLKSRMAYCTFLHSSESSSYPVIMLGTTASGWELLSYQSNKFAPTIITYNDGQEEIIKLPLTYNGSVISGSTVLESAIIQVTDIKEKLKNISKLEFQFGSAEYLWINDAELTNKALNYVN